MAASDPRMIKLESIAIGAVGTAGEMGTTLTTVDKIVPGSAIVIFEPGSDIDHFIEDSECPDVSVTGKSVRRFEFATRKTSGANFLLAFGGSNDTTAAIWRAPQTAATELIRSVEMISAVYDSTKLTFEIVRAKLASSGNFPFTETDTGTIKFAGKILNPTTVCAPIVITAVTT